MSSGGTEKPAGGARSRPEPPAPKGSAGAKPAAGPPPRAAGGNDPAASAKDRAEKQGVEKRGAERRQHPRVAARVPFRIVNQAGRDEAFRLVDLSECGARIQVKNAIPAMTRIQVALFLPGSRMGGDEELRVDTAGVVVWCHPTEDFYDTGVFFPDLRETERLLLRDLVRKSS